MTVDPEALARVMAATGHRRFGPERWAHLPGGGVGPWTPPAHRKVRVKLIGLVKPVFLIGLVVFAVLACVREFPSMIGGMTGHSRPVVSVTPTPHLRPHPVRTTHHG